MHVLNFEPKTVPNPTCCSNKSTMCPKCAEQALKQAGSQVSNSHKGKKTDPIPESPIVWGK